MFAKAGFGFEPADRLREIDVVNENKNQGDAKNLETVKAFRVSKARKLYLDFLVKLNQSVIGRTLTSVEESKQSASVKKFLALLNDVDKLIDANPALTGPSRFGNVAFRSFLTALQEQSEKLLASVVPGTDSNIVSEIAAYLNASFGDMRRIDYGTGHEINFSVYFLARCMHLNTDPSLQCAVCCACICCTCSSRATLPT